jgi:hypothetical protein
MNTQGKKFGYANFINANLTTNIMTFTRNFCQHSNSIKTVEIWGIDDPHIWLPHYVERIIFENCFISSYINPGEQAYVTKSLKITDYHRHNSKTQLRINWECFPNLEELELYVHDVDLTNIKQCKLLKSLKINFISTDNSGIFIEGYNSIRLNLF